MATSPEPGARIELDGALNLRDLGGWSTPDGPVRRRRLYRSDRLHGLSDADLGTLDGLAIDVVIDLRHDGEVAEHPNRLWSTVRSHQHIAMGGDLARQGSFLERALAGEMGEVTDEDVAQSYRELLATHGPELGQAVTAVLEAEVALYHCTAGKDRTGLLSMLILSSVGVSDDDILADFVLSNVYRANVRVEQLRATFAEAGIDIEALRPALSAPRPAMVAAIEWINTEYGSAARYLAQAGGVPDADQRLRRALLPRP